jgi:uncharacterized protein YgbK (DUF1537 family)
MQHRSGSAAVVADDMTGAADCALAFGEAGWIAHLELDGDWTPFPRDGSPTAAAYATDVRAAAGAVAAAATERAVRAARAAGADRIYLKVDSTGRGSLAAQVAGARAALGDPLTVLCPAFPAVGRTVAAGRLHVDGRDAASGAAGADPITPLPSSDLTALVPGAHAADRLAPGADGVVVLDAATEGDLERIAASLAELERHGPVLAVGSAGLARALARAWHPEPRDVAVPAPRTDLVVVSSLNPATRTQVAHAEAHGVLHRELDVERSSDAELQAAIRALLATGGPAIASTRPDRAGLHGTGAQRIARRLGAATAHAVRAARPAAIGLVGGDGASAVLTALAEPRALVAGRIAPGIPLLRLPGAGLAVWTKAGGFGPPPLLTDLVLPAH